LLLFVIFSRFSALSSGKNHLERLIPTAGSSQGKSIDDRACDDLNAEEPAVPLISPKQDTGIPAGPLTLGAHHDQGGDVGEGD
jgi:hypothetical protein